MTPPAPCTLPQFAAVMTRIGLTSFGGGMSGWMLRMVVHDRGWMTEAEFLSGLGLCQVFPGINVLNLAIWLGYRLHGGRGALAGAVAIVVPPGLLAVAGLALLSEAWRNPLVATGLEGVAAAAIGLGAAMGFRAARRCLAPVPLAFMVATFVGVGVLRLPLLTVLVPLAPLSVALAWRRA